MAIDLRTEHVVGLSEAPAIMPRIGGKRPHKSTIWRWCRKGIRGINL
jgi:hypothetical protein